MKISRNFSQFEDRQALIIVTGRQEALIYLAKDGVIELLNSDKMEGPNYTFKENFFVRKGRGVTFGAGAVYENLKGKKMEQLLSDLEGMVKEALEKHSITDIYIFSPGRIYSSLDKFIPHPHKEKVRKYIKGNYCRKHPFFFLEKISETKG